MRCSHTIRQHYDAVTPTGYSLNSAYVHRSSGTSRKPRTGLACRNGVENSAEQIIENNQGQLWVTVAPHYTHFFNIEFDRNPTPGLVLAGAETCETLEWPLFNTIMLLIIRKFKHQFDKRMLCNTLSRIAPLPHPKWTQIFALKLFMSLMQHKWRQILQTHTQKKNNRVDVFVWNRLDEHLQMNELWDAHWFWDRDGWAFYFSAIFSF